jgi:DNA mismatch repair ATPase MutS
MKNYGIDFAKTTAMPEEVLRRAEELAAIVGKGDEVALLAAVTFIKIFYRP